jgi:hypothetical protein
MNPKVMKEILSTHADQLVHGEHPQAEDYEGLSAKDQNEISPLLNVAEKIGSAVRPVKPPQRFEVDLKKELLTTAYLRQAEGYRPPNPERELLIVGLVIGFVISLVGSVIAWRVYRWRNQPL